MDDIENGTQELKSEPSLGLSKMLLQKDYVRKTFKSASIIFVVMIILLGATLLIRRYTSQDHSIYGKLNRFSYSKNGLNFSFEYPSIMDKNTSIASKLPSAPIAYTYYVNQSLQAVVAVSHENIGSNLKILNLQPSQYILQIRNGSGSYINALNFMQGIKDSAKIDFPGCKHIITTNSGQMTVLCVNNPSNYINARIIGATDTTQYTLELIMKPSIWSAHQKAWEEIEKSFSFH